MHIVGNAQGASMASIVVFTGHMMDKAGRVPPLFAPRFPPEKEPECVAAIAEALERMDPRAGYSSAACGADILFIEQMLARDAEVHLVLPYAEEQFIADCIEVPAGAGPQQQFLQPHGRTWKERYLAMRPLVSSVLVLGDKRPRDNSSASDCCNRVFLGMGMMRAQHEQLPISLLTLWDGWSGDAPGGTRSLVKLADSLGIPVEYLSQLRPRNVEEILLAASPPPGIGAAPFRATLDREPPQQVCAVLFADVVRFSKLDETALPDFVTQYLQPLAGIIQAARHGGYGPLDFNTWGDGLFCVFDSMLKACRLAVAMRHLTASGDWMQDGAGESLALRIALHAGPVYRIPDPVFPKDTFVGTNISLAARIEPATEPGEIYCSQAFAALAAAEGIRDYGFECLGERRLAKDAGTLTLYRLVG